MIHEKQTFLIKSSAKMHLNKTIVFASSVFSWPPMFTLFGFYSFEELRFQIKTRHVLMQKCNLFCILSL